MPGPMYLEACSVAETSVAADLEACVVRQQLSWALEDCSDP